MASFFTVLEVATFLLGVILGSFLNALLFRFNTGRGFIKGMSGRSRCMHCRHTLKAADLVPIISFVLLRGRCRYCGTKISWQYPLVEFGAGLLSLLIFTLFYPNLVTYALWLVIWLTILFIVVYDLRHMIIPWSASLFLILLAVANLIFGCQVPGASFQLSGFSQIFAACHLSPVSFFAGPLVALPLLLLSLVSWGRWMGWADSLFELSLGWLLGLSLGATALMLAIWIGALVGIIIIALSKRATMTLKSEIPFAPFLALGAAIAFFLHVDFFSTLPLLFR